MYRRGPFWGGRYMRRRGFPLFPMGGYGMGMGMGGFMGDLVAGGIGYLLGKQSAQQAQQYQTPQYQGPPPQYQTPQYQPPQTPQYQTPQYQPPQAPQYQTPQYQPPAAGGGNERLAQLRLLGHLRDSGLLTNDEFEAEKRKIMQG